MAKTKKQVVHHTDHEGKPNPIDAIRARANSDLVDKTVGPMTLPDIASELRNIVYLHDPDYVVIIIEKRKDMPNKYQTAVYLTREDFKKKKKWY